MKRIHLLFGLVVAVAIPARADDTYQVSKSDAVVAVGSPGKASVTISAKQGWHLNAEAPITVKLGTTEGLQTDKAKLGRADLALSTETQARFDIGVTASEPGKKTLEVDIGFVLCREDACRPIKEKVSLVVDSAPPTKAEPVKKTKKKS
jgi:hypothetical protein